MSFCSYYQAYVDPAQGWFFVGVLRSFEHVAFDRTIDVEHSIFEFFVPQDTEIYFLDIMRHFQDTGVVKNLCKMDNRLTQADAVL